MTPFPTSFLAKIMQTAPFQPATNYWRAIELTVLIEKGFPRLKGARAIFDLGCGDGEIMRLLKMHLPVGSSITGMDIDEAEIALARQSGVYSRVLCGSADAVPLPDASQEAIISNSVLEHVGPLEAVLQESGRILCQGGWFLATVPAPDFHACLRGSWRRGVSRADYLRQMDERLVHLRYWTAQEWRDHLSRAGIEMTDCIPYLSLSETRRWELLTRLTGGLLYMLTGGRKRPIALQRALGVRRRMMAPCWLAGVIAWVVCLGVRQDPPSETRNACFLVVGRRI